MSDGLGFWSTVGLSFTKTLGSVIDNVAVNIDSSIQAHERGDSQWAVVLGAAAGMLLPLAAALSGPTIKASRLGPYLTRSRTKAVGAVIFAVLFGLKVFGALDAHSTPGGGQAAAPKPAAPHPIPSAPVTSGAH